MLQFLTVMRKEIRKNSALAWVLAARPKTLAGAAVPVLMGLSLAWYDMYSVHSLISRPDMLHFNWMAAGLCLLFAFAMQVAANFVNDYFDFKKGADNEQRLGPKRACAQGWIDSRLMLRGIAVVLFVACCLGLPLVYWGGWWLIGIGLLCVIFCILYTTYFSYWGLGDVLVLLFFGVVPVCMTYYVQVGMVGREVFCASLACGLVVDTLLVVNNYRDRDNDRQSGKMTIVVRLGATNAEWVYLLLGVAGCLLGLVFFVERRWMVFFLPFVYLLFHVRTACQMRKIGHGRALNGILGKTARNIFFFGVFFSVGAIMDCLVDF